ncbi:MAG TPA: CehA/McbA family metallohydrolase [Jiangellaceae bacterium]|nr:CehA/McbA family metallohydrolase [Jiangellaceae bacterium]
MKIQRRITLDDRAASPYVEVPFEVAPPVESVEVRLTYDATAGVVDLGCIGPAGFRGWSGGARDRFVITPDAATPGYLAGEPEEGVWSVLLGLHRIPADGLELTLDVLRPATVPPDAEPPAPPTPQRPSGRELPAGAGLRWLACDLHAHTAHSDGSLGVAELAAAAVTARLDVLAVTDHNTVSHHPSLPETASRYGVTLVAGQEITTDRGHANAFGDIGWVDFRQPPQSWVSAVPAAGGLLSINHPLAADTSWHHPLTERPPLAEVWHWSWLDRRWTGPLAWWAAWGHDTVPVGGSDFHHPADGHLLGSPVTWVACESDEPAAVLDGLRAGRTALAAGIDDPALLRVDDELVAVGADGTLLTDRHGRRQVVRGDLARFPATPGPHVLETPLAEVVAISP